MTKKSMVLLLGLLISNVSHPWSLFSSPGSNNVPSKEQVTTGLFVGGSIMSIMGFKKLCSYFSAENIKQRRVARDYKKMFGKNRYKHCTDGMTNAMNRQEARLSYQREFRQDPYELNCFTREAIKEDARQRRYNAAQRQCDYANADTHAPYNAPKIARHQQYQRLKADIGRMCSVLKIDPHTLFSPWADTTRLQQVHEETTQKFREQSK